MHSLLEEAVGHHSNCESRFADATLRATGTQSNEDHAIRVGIMLTSTQNDETIRSGSNGRRTMELRGQFEVTISLLIWPEVNRRGDERAAAVRFAQNRQTQTRKQHPASTTFDLDTEAISECTNAPIWYALHAHAQM